MKKFWSVLLAVMICLTMAACGGGKEEGGTTNPPDNPVDPTPDPTEKVFYDTRYDPTTFSKDSVSYTVTKLGDGARLVKNSYKLANGNDVVVWAAEVDLAKADIKAGCYNDDPAQAFDKVTVPYSQFTAWEANHPDRKALFAMNADFFAKQSNGGAISVNAFVKDGVIVKDSHNDNGNYDYKNLASDVPASAPMLFGIKGTTAQIGPIKNYTGDVESAAVKQSLIQSKLRYAASLTGRGTKHTFLRNQSADGVTDALVYLDEVGKSFAAKARTIVCKIKLTGQLTGEVTEVSTLDLASTLTPEEGYALIVSGPDYRKGAELADVTAGTEIAVKVASDDGKWDGFETIIGCRQALIVDGQIPATVSKENTNGAQSKSIPRSCVGVKGDGTVVLFGVESLRYGVGDDDGTTGEFGDETDPCGLSLPELADFIRYYNCAQAANFDGGGSTQVIVRDGYNGSGDPKVVVRSSDTGKTDPAKSRPVFNTVLITTKQA